MMVLEVAIVDETTKGEITNRQRLRLRQDRLTLRELIVSRVRTEVDEHNRTRPETFQGLVQPTDSEKILNGFRFREGKFRPVDEQVQSARAIESFERNGFFVIVDGQQVEKLEQELQLTPQSEVHFLKLVPLVGG